MVRHPSRTRPGLGYLLPGLRPMRCGDVIMTKIIPITYKKKTEWRYSITRGYRLVDCSLMDSGSNPSIWDSTTREWKDGGDLPFLDIIASVPIHEEEAEKFMRDGTISDRARRRLDMGPHDTD